MKSVLWTGITTVLIMEICLLLVLCAPLPWGVRKNLSRWIFQMRAYDRIQTIMNYMLFALCLAVVESLNELRSVYMKLAQPDNTDETEGQTAESGQATSTDDHYNFAKGYLNWQKVRAERNVYLAAFTVTAFLAIIRLVRLATIEMHLRDKIKEFNGGKDITEVGDALEAELEAEAKKST